MPVAFAQPDPDVPQGGGSKVWGLFNCRPPVLAGAIAAEAATATAPTAARAMGATAEASTLVMVTRTGTKYHRPGYKTLRGGGIASTLGEALRRFGPCSVCRPPVLSATATSTTSGTSATAAATGAARPAASSGRCQAITKKGTQCSRAAKPGTSYCWQHGGEE